MKTCVCTIVSGDKYEKLGKTTHYQFMAYAKRIGADFKVGRKPDFAYSPPWIKLILLEKLLAIYDRVIFFDTDLTIHPELPNLFDMVPETHLGAYFEGAYLDRIGALARALDFHKIKNEREYEGEYFNSGVMVLSKQHRDLFIWPDEIEDNFYEQSLLNARVFASNTPVFKLHYHYNRMSSHDTMTGEDVHAAKIVHFAGMPETCDIAANMAVIQDKWARNEKALTRVHISCGGGIGDVVMSEPIVRYILTRVWPEAEYPDYRFTLSTGPHCVRVFQHLKHWNRLNIICTQKELDPKVCYLTIETHPHHDRVMPFFTYPQMHNQHWSGMSALLGYIPPEDLRIKLTVNPEDNDELPKTINELKSIAVHCGIGWPSKTFPVEYWQEIVNGLSALGFQVVLFGKRIAELVDTETGNVVKVDKGVQDVKCPHDGIDLRDKLSLGGLFALAQKCKATLTNDSLPLHPAGAFDNWLFLIASCKHPNLVMPYRMGCQTWRARYFLNRLTLSIENNKPNSLMPRSIKDVDGDILDYLPSPNEVVQGIYNAICPPNKWEIGK